MKEPMEGLKILIDILEPHGFLNIGLYSEIARKHIIKTRELIMKKGLTNTIEEIKNFRQDIINSKVDTEIQKSANFYDFYSMSGVRDFLFHFRISHHRPQRQQDPTSLQTPSASCRLRAR